MIETIYIFFIILLLIASHEFGHYWVAKRQGIYDKLSIIPWVGPAVKMKRTYNSRWDYLSGLVYSFFALPFFLLGRSLGYIDGPWWTFLFLAIGLAFGDILIVVLHKKNFQVKKMNRFLKFLEKHGFIEVKE